jgi:hypothetical protein
LTADFEGGKLMTIPPARCQRIRHRARHAQLFDLAVEEMMA